MARGTSVQNIVCHETGDTTVRFSRESLSIDSKKSSALGRNGLTRLGKKWIVH